MTSSNHEIHPAAISRKQSTCSAMCVPVGQPEGLTCKSNALPPQATFIVQLLSTLRLSLQLLGLRLSGLTCFHQPLEKKENHACFGSTYTKTGKERNWMGGGWLTLQSTWVTVCRGETSSPCPHLWEGHFTNGEVVGQVSLSLHPS